ncbi:MAG: hotdog fold thioesterase [Cellulomonadaceae bacterium]|nr:hotdog fold thioesterase [Cellulomonadaceae bacterium]
MSTLGPAGELVTRMGIELLEASPERVVARMPVAGNRQPHGLLHGGAFCTLGETVGSVAANLHAGPGAHAVGVELSATHHRSVREGVVTATATAVSLGRTLCCHQVSITDDDGRLLSSVRITNMVRRVPATDGPSAVGAAGGPEVDGGGRSVDAGGVPIVLEGLAGHRQLVRFGQMEVGVWQHGVGSSDDLESDEVAVVLSGAGTVTWDDGATVSLVPGVVLALREGERTRWHVTEPLRKVYVNRL